MTAGRVPAMGRRIDLSGLTDEEAEHVLQVVQRDMRLRKNEEERLSELKQELDEEGSRCLLLSRQSCFNQRCCIRCCSSFSFLLNPRRRCCDCHHNICKACRTYSKRDKSWLCCTCQKTRLLKTQSLDWFYTNVKKRFNRFGSAKVLKTLYRKHLAEHSTLSELTEGSACDESICNEGSVCESDSTFYRQSEERSMAEMLTVALRVAEEAIDEAISKAEFDSASQEKQNEAHYLREHRAQLTEELAKTIVQKIIHRRKTLAEIKTKLDQDWAFDRPQSSCDPSSSSLKHPSGLWRSHSAFSLSADGPSGFIQDSSQTLKKEGSGPALSAWRSVDRLDNAGVSSVLKSPDGNWIALQSAQLSRPSLLTKRKSLVYSALERESGVVSAYEGMDSDVETKPELDTSWGVVLHEIHRKMADSNLNLQDTQDRILPTPTTRQSNKDEEFSDSEGNWASNKPLLTFVKKKLPVEMRRPLCSPRTSIIDMNFNTEQAEGETHSSVGAEPEAGNVRTSRKKRKSKKERVQDSHKDWDRTCDALTPDTLNSGATTPETFDHESDEQAVGTASDPSAREEQLVIERDEGHKRMWDVDEERREDDEDMKDRLYRLVAQSRLTYFSSTDEELDKVGECDGKWEEDVEKEGETEAFTSRLCQLEEEARATQLSSTEDELDRAAADEELALKVCRLANQVNAAQFSSTEEELDVAERGDDDEGEEELWKFQAGKVVGAAQLRDLACLVSNSQFSSTEDELDRVEDSLGVRRDDVKRRESFGDLDVEMFDLRGGSDERVTDVQTGLKDLSEEHVGDEAEKSEDETQEMKLETMAPEETEGGGKSGDRKESRITWDTTEEEAEEDAEFDRMISSMLMMTLEDMQHTDATDNTRRSREASENVQTVGESRDEETAVGQKRMKESEETGRDKDDEKVKRTNEAEDTRDQAETDRRAGSVSDAEPSSTCFQTPEEIQKRFSAASLRSITTEMLKVLNATEELLQGVEGAERAPPPSSSLPPDSDPTKLDRQFSSLEENVYVAAGSVFSLEAELSDLEECARGICSSTSEMELCFLEEQVASAAAKVQQSELQIRDISARIAALKSAGLNVDTQSRPTKTRNIPVMPATLDSSRQLRRRLPAPPVKEDKPT